MATFPNTPIIGTRMIEEPSSEHMSAKEYVWLPRTVPNGGKPKVGSPDRTVPKKNWAQSVLICTYDTNWRNIKTHNMIHQIWKFSFLSTIFTEKNGTLLVTSYQDLKGKLLHTIIGHLKRASLHIKE